MNWLASPLRRVTARFAVLALVAASVVVAQGGAQVAAAAANDNFADATTISSFPYADSGDLNGTTIEPGEPAFNPQTVWYRFSATANGAVAVVLRTSYYDMAAYVYQSVAGGFSGLQLRVIAYYYRPAYLIVEPGATYYIQIGSSYGETASFQLSVDAIPPPTNDDLANATAVASLPYSDTVEHFIAGTREPGELAPCWGGNQSSTVWWAFTPPAADRYTASVIGDFDLYASLTVYTGSSMADLQQVACGDLNHNVTFQAASGETYYVQASGYAQSDRSLQFALDVAPQPTAGFYVYPWQPTVYDMVSFIETSSDPGGMSFLSEAWSFGDGTTSTGWNVNHQYAADGDYTVGLTVTTVDGRTASTSQVVSVRTHDAAITKFTVPQSASVGQTRSITVGVSVSRYPETVQVELSKSVLDGFVTVGTLTQSVPVLPANRTTPFAFSYTFTADDAAVGTVTFRAVATVMNAQDVNRANNTATAMPTKVNP